MLTEPQYHHRREKKKGPLTRSLKVLDNPPNQTCPLFSCPLSTSTHFIPPGTWLLQCSHLHIFARAVSSTWKALLPTLHLLTPTQPSSTEKPPIRPVAPVSPTLWPAATAPWVTTITTHSNCDCPALPSALWVDKVPGPSTDHSLLDSVPSNQACPQQASSYSSAPKQWLPCASSDTTGSHE